MRSLQNSRAEPGGPVDLTIIGTGNMGRAIAARALAGGHDVTLIGTEVEKAQQLANELGGS